MNLQKSMYYLVALMVLLMVCSTASAAMITDETGDVLHWAAFETQWVWKGNVSYKPNLDIVELSSSVSGDTLSLSLQVRGAIQSSQYILYSMFYNSTDTNYSFVWSNGNGYGWVGGNSDIVSKNFTVAQGTLSVDFPILGDSSAVDFWGTTVEYSSLEDQTIHEWWGDWAPDSKFTGEVVMNDENTTVVDGNYTTGDGNNTTNGGNNTTNGNTEKPGIPGFEALGLILAVSIVLVFLRRNR